MRSDQSLRPLVLAVTIALAATSPVLAQPTAPPNTGTRLRVWSPALQQRHPLVGRLLSADSTQLMLGLSNGSIAYYPWPDIDSLQVSRGRTGGQGRRFALIGALCGGLGLATALLASADTQDGSTIDMGAAAGVAFVIGAGLGALIGGGIGATLGEERWESLPLRTRVGLRHPLPARSLVFAMTVARFQ